MNVGAIRECDKINHFHGSFLNWFCTQLIDKAQTLINQVLLYNNFDKQPHDIFYEAENSFIDFNMCSAQQCKTVLFSSWTDLYSSMF